MGVNEPWLTVYNRSHDRAAENQYRACMNYLTPTRWPWLALILSGGLLGGALFFEHMLGYAPCQMCYWQRHAHKVVIGLSVAAIILNHFDLNLLGKNSPKIWAGLIGLAFLASLSIAFWHVGVEYKWWEGPKTCMTGTPSLERFSGSDLIDSLSKPVKLPGCSEPAWHFIGLSMASWNALASLLGAILSFLSLKGRTNA